MRAHTHLAGLVALATLLAGCTTTFRTADDRFMAHPHERRQVQIAPVGFVGTAKTDRTLTTNDLAELSARTGNQLCSALRQALSAKGYEVVEPVVALPQCAEGPLADTNAAAQVEALRKEVRELAASYGAYGAPLTFRADGPAYSFRYAATNQGETVRRLHNPFRRQMSETLTSVLAQLGATNASTVLLVETRAFFQSRHQHTKGLVWNWSAGALLATTEVAINLVGAAGGGGGGGIWIDPFWRNRNSIRHLVVLVDARSRDVLWINMEDFDYADARTERLAQSLGQTLGDLPDIEKQQGCEGQPTGQLGP
jgi:hypothetical protein